MAWRRRPPGRAGRSLRRRTRRWCLVALDRPFPTPTVPPASYSLRGSIRRQYTTAVYTTEEPMRTRNNDASRTRHRGRIPVTRDEEAQGSATRGVLGATRTRHFGSEMTMPMPTDPLVGHLVITEERRLG